jgi:cardiolipin synthase
MVNEGSGNVPPPREGGARLAPPPSSAEARDRAPGEARPTTGGPSMAGDPLDDIRRVEQGGLQRRKHRIPRGVAVGLQEAREGLSRFIAEPEAQSSKTFWTVMISIVAIAIARTVHSHPEWTWWTIFAFIAGVFHTSGLFAAVHALLTAQSSQAQIAWSISLVTFPWVSLPLYLLLGRSRFEGYRQAFGAGRLKRTGDIADLVLKPMKSYPCHITHADRETLQVYESLARVPFTCGNKVDLLVNGEATYASMFGAIEEAERYVLVFFFIVNDDGVGRALHRRLVERAQAGVRVVFVYDDWGSWWLTRTYIDELRNAGVEVQAFTSGPGLYNKLQVNFRNHRKIVVVDGRVALVGGLNVGDEQLGLDKYYGAWRDTHLRIEGPAVQGVQLVFQEDYHWASGGKLLDLDWEPHPADGDVDALYLASGPTEPMQVGLLYFLHSINAARQRLWISSPYFVPDSSVLDALKLASLRGVDVRILLPGHYDHWYMYLAAMSYLPELHEETGIKIYIDPMYNHQKVILVDDWLTAIGSANLDNRSMRLNFEGNMVMASRRLAREVEQMLEADFARARMVTTDQVARMSAPKRVAARVCRLFDTIL